MKVVTTTSRERAAISCIALAVLAMSLSVHWRRRAASAPNVLDFGTLSSTATVVHDFEISNTGSGELRVLDVFPSCGCIAHTVSSDVCGPGDSITLRVRLPLHGLRGVVEKTVTVETNDPAKPMQTFRIIGTVDSILDITPGEFVVTRFPDGTSTGSAIQIRPGQDDVSGFTVQSVKTTSRYVTALLQPHGTIGYTVHVQPVDPLPWGMSPFHVHIHTDLERDLDIIVPARIQLSQNIPQQHQNQE
jgi:hypothetical protein